MRKTTKQKNKLYIIIAALVILFGIGAAIFMSFPPVSNQLDNTKTITRADEIKLEGLKLINSDSKKAKELFQQALAMYQTSKDTNNIVDIESLIYLVDHKK